MTAVVVLPPLNCLSFGPKEKVVRDALPKPKELPAAHGKAFEASLEPQGTAHQAAAAVLPLLKPKTAQQLVNDNALCVLWIGLRIALEKAGVVIADNEMIASAEDIKKWLSNHPDELAKLKRLDFTGYPLSIIPEEFAELYLPNLEEIEITNCRLTELPAHFGCNWPKLKYLMIADTKLCSLPDGFGDCWPEMEAVYLQRNEIARLPRQFGKAWKKLEEMMLFQNRLKELPKHFGYHWTKLVVLDISFNKLTTLFEGFGSRWNDLEALFCRNNEIAWVPSTLGVNWRWWGQKCAEVFQNNPVQNSVRIRDFMSRIAQSDEITNLYTKASKNGPWNIEFGEIPKGAKAMICHKNRMICIDPKLSQDKAFGNFVFELLNALVDDSHLVDRARKHQISKEAYVKEIERSEHENLLEHHAIMQRAIQTLSWNDAVDVFPDPNPDFEEVWLREIKGSAHARFYEEAWEELTQERGAVHV